MLFVFFGGEFSEAVFDCDGGVGGGKVYVDGFHFGGVEFEESEFCVDSSSGVELEHVYFEIGHEQRIAFGVCEGDFGEEVSFFVEDVDLAGRTVFFRLFFWLEVVHAVFFDVTFEGVFFIGRAFGAPACLFA